MKRLTLLIFIALLGSALFLEYKRLTEKPWPARHFETDLEHFKYGSIGGEVNGYPFQIWRELPALFPDKIPDGFSEFGFLYEEGSELPIGISVRRIGVDRVGFNCSTCHVSTYTFGSETELVMGAPANGLDIQTYIEFLIEVSKDERLTADAVIESARSEKRPLNMLDAALLRYAVFPRLDEEITRLEANLEWLARRPRHGPGRTDAGNFWREKWKLHPELDDRVGTVDFPSVWNQRIRLEGRFHWDGNNRSLDERNISAALAGGAPEWLLERRSIKRVSDWLLDLPPPDFPVSIDDDLAATGRHVYTRAGCGSCHDAGSPSLGQVTSAAILGTDAQRTELFDREMVAYFDTVGQAYSWQFSKYQATDGYANMPLDGIWMRAPYLHNGSVPTLMDLLEPEAARPVQIYRGCDAFDPVKVGFVCESGFLFDTSLPGNDNEGHRFGTDLTESEKAALIEYLKTQ